VIKARFIFAMLLVIFFTSCAHWEWNQTRTGATDFNQAHSDCQVKARVVCGYNANIAGCWNPFMMDCMAGQGWSARAVSNF